MPRPCRPAARLSLAVLGPVLPVSRSPPTNLETGPAGLTSASGKSSDELFGRLGQPAFGLVEGGVEGLEPV